MLYCAFEKSDFADDLLRYDTRWGLVHETSDPPAYTIAGYPILGSHGEVIRPTKRQPELEAQP